jgi:Rad3-related DNA helicase
MAKNIYKNDSQAVTKYISEMKPEDAALCELIREAILESDEQIDEFIKWNVPAYFYKGEMKPYDLKEYKRDMLVFNTRQKDHILVVLPSGAKLTNINNHLEGNYPDGRRLIKFYSQTDFLEKKMAFQQIIKEWISMVE